MTTHIHAVDVTKFYSKLNSFRNAERHTDVTVECMDGSFNCHRLALSMACDYFDAMFEESNVRNIALPSVNAATFEQVLEFVYTGNVAINSSNLRDLLEAGAFLQSSGIEDLCVVFVLRNNLTIQTTLDLFAFARSTGRNPLCTILGRYIADQLDIFGQLEKFLDLSSDDFKFILDCQSPLLSQNAESLHGTIARWTRRHQGEQLCPQYLDEVQSMIKFENISDEYMRYVWRKFIKYPNQFETTRPIGYSEISELPKNARLEANTSLHVFVEHDTEKLMRVFSINRARHCSVSADVAQTDYSLSFQCVSDNSHVYCLTGASWLRINTNFPEFAGKQKLYASPSINMCPEVSLRSPPILFGSNIMCATRNNLYVYKDYIFDKAIRTYSSCPTTFNDEEINRGILAYNFELDNWFAVPVLKKKLQEAAFAACEGSLFLIGGMDSNQSLSPSGYAQALDYRSGKWRALPRTYGAYHGAACCAMEGKLYVCGGGEESGKEAERYDPVAGKWEKICPTNRRWVYHKAVNYSNQLWVMGCHLNGHGELTEDLSIEVYNPKLNMWRTFSALQEVAEKTTFAGNVIIEAVAFKSF